MGEPLLEPSTAFPTSPRGVFGSAFLLLSLLSPLALAASPKAQGDTFQGFLIAANATDVISPEFTFRVGGWNSNWGSVKLLELAPDGKDVKKDAVIARFEFIGRDAQTWINERIQRAQADDSQGRVEADQALESLAMELRRKGIEARLAGLNLERERSVSKNQAAVDRLSATLAAFEVDASTQRLESRRRTGEAEREFREQAVKQAKEGLDRYAFYEKRFSLLAPHAGVVRHAFNPRERRKVKKGDGIGSGFKVMSVGRDATLAVRFFVPEHQLTRVKVGEQVTVGSDASAEELPAVVKSIGFFPQELGYLLENEDLPNGREKAFEVKAEFPTPPKEMPAGSEVRVRLKAP